MVVTMLCRLGLVVIYMRLVVILSLNLLRGPMFVTMTGYLLTRTLMCWVSLLMRAPKVRALIVLLLV